MFDPRNFIKKENNEPQIPYYWQPLGGSYLLDEIKMHSIRECEAEGCVTPERLNQGESCDSVPCQLGRHRGSLFSSEHCDWISRR